MTRRGDSASPSVGSGTPRGVGLLGEGDRSAPSVTDQLVIREARREDLPAILTLLVADAIREVPEAGDERNYVAAFEEIDADPNALLLVGERHGEVVATCQLTFLRHLIYNGGLMAQIESVRTASHLRGQGVGTALMRWCIDEAHRRGAARIQLTSNKQRVDAHRFYERLGFRSTHVGMKLYLG